jgi:hypothetical protein
MKNKMSKDMVERTAFNDGYTVYVDTHIGDDKHTGLHPEGPKRNITEAYKLIEILACTKLRLFVNGEEAEIHKVKTQEAIRNEFLGYCRHMVYYWSQDFKEEKSLEDRLVGLAHSILCLLDGVAHGYPAYEIIPCPHEHDKAHCQEDDQDWYPPYPYKDDKKVVTVHGGHMLHELFLRG